MVPSRYKTQLCEKHQCAHTRDGILYPDIHGCQVLGCGNTSTLSSLITTCSVALDRVAPATPSHYARPVPLVGTKWIQSNDLYPASSGETNGIMIRFCARFSVHSLTSLVELGSSGHSLLEKQEPLANKLPEEWACACVFFRISS